MEISLEQARRRAKELLRAARAGDTVLRADREPRLADAQHAVAQELGFASWPVLTAHVDATAGDREQRRARFIAYALDGRRARAQALLDNDPRLPGSSLACALVLGDRETVVADTSGLERAPILYVTHSAFLQPGSPREADLLATLALLLERGADPNATFANEHGDMSAIYGAAGVAHNPAATRMLLAAGADPNDGESVYHAVEAQDTTCLRILLEEGGATALDTNALGNALDDAEKVRIILESGTLRPDQWELRDSLLHVKRDAVARLLLAHGAPVDIRDDDGLTPYDRQARRGDTSLMAILADADAGGAGDPDPICAWLGSVLRGEPIPRPEGQLRWSDCELLPMWASAGEDESVARLLDAGLPIESCGIDNGTALHYAGLWGHPSTVALLIARGADVEQSSNHGTPAGWTRHGAERLDPKGERAADYDACLDALRAAGAEVVLDSDLE